MRKVISLFPLFLIGSLILAAIGTGSNNGSIDLSKFPPKVTDKAKIEYVYPTSD